jgi:NADH-quinone oxidoreductase subunit C
MSNAPPAAGNGLENLAAYLKEKFGDAVTRVIERFGELTLEIRCDALLNVCRTLRDDAPLRFEQLIDVCVVDYLEFAKEAPGRQWRGARFAVVYHLLSVAHNRRLRLRVFLEDAPADAVNDDIQRAPSVVEIWNGANWFEREAFDLFGIIFEGHPDLRRILTDYGFIGYPFRKDFPLSGHVEMRYDAEKERVVYQPVTIEPRILVPRVIREEGFGKD